jgi:hypothetical protein
MVKLGDLGSARSALQDAAAQPGAEAATPQCPGAGRGSPLQLPPAAAVGGRLVEGLHHSDSFLMENPSSRDLFARWGLVPAS